MTGMMQGGRVGVVNDGGNEMKTIEDAVRAYLGRPRRSVAFTRRLTPAQVLNATNAQPESNGDNWHERGEFPPVGTVCEYLDRDGVWRQVEFLARTKKGAVIEWDDCEFLVKVTPSGFRPIRSDRERWIDGAMKIWRDSRSQFVEGAMEEIHDALESGELPTPKAERTGQGSP